MTNRSRREFLENSMFATAAAVAAGASTQTAFAKDEQSDSPNELLRVAVVGVRGRGRSHLGAFSGRKDTEVAIICDADEAVGQAQVEAIHKKTGKKPKYVKDMREAYDDKSIDIVSIATPNHWHALATIWAVQAGKDVYVEKPVSHNVSEGRRMVQAARKYDKIVQTGTQCRSTKATNEAVDYVQSGQIGDCNFARGLCYKPRGPIGPAGKYDVPGSVDYDLWTGPAALQPLTRPKLHYDWHWVWNTGNGDLGNQGIHQMDICRWGIGATSVGKRVMGFGGRFGYEDAGETANTEVTFHDYGDKKVIFEVRGLKTGAERGAKIGVIFYGSNGYVVMTSYNGGAAFDLDGNVVKKFSGGDDHFGNFVKAVRSRKVSDLNADIEEGHYSSAMCHLGNISMRMGEMVTAKEAEARLSDDSELAETYDRFSAHLRENGVDLSQNKMHFGPMLEIDPESEEFIGEHARAANPWLTREYRKGFEVPSEANL
ncbi:Gfo/Idh/MocA family protein [Thalassoroseus pseudoceratinae]|uniref:Gfo/Idh/MocA family protein n=1 Tax=Thalassoroseus pseudoceratinae TaxID=2713176 RepID=UPI00142279D9|nr:Gfo/Idh/MocA family oxidoreductase [Thalassoroseus pseudoceratinae]